MHAATPELEREIGPEDPEYLEAVAMNAAADDSLRLASADAGAAPARVVIAAEVGGLAAASADHSRAGGEGLLPTACYLEVPLEWNRVDSIHVDSDEVAADVQLARGGDDEAFERVAEEDLMWYDVAERDLLAREMIERAEARH